MTLHRTPGTSTYDRHMRPPIPSTKTSSCSSMKLIAPSPTAKAVTCRPFLMSWTFTHLRSADFGCFASIATFSRTIPFACGEPRAGPISLSAAARAACNTGPTIVGSGVRPSACVPRRDHVPTSDPGRVRSKSHVLFKGRVPRKSGVRPEGDDPFAVRAYDAFLREVPRVDVAPAVRTFSGEVLLLHRILRDELVACPVDGAFDQAFIKRFPEELLRLEPRLPESLRHEVHLDSPLGLRPARELDDGLLATPLSYPDRDRDDARDDRDRAAQIQEERDVVQQDDEEEAEEQREAAHREVRDRVEIEQARSARRQTPSDEPAVLQPGDVRITETH